MLYLLDADVLIRAHGDYYPLDRVPQFWVWLLAQAKKGKVKVPFEIAYEISNGTDLLTEWINSPDVKDVLILEEEVDQSILNNVLKKYAHDLNDNEIEQIGCDPFLISYVAADASRCLVTKEVSKPSRQRANRKVPDVCNDVGVKHMSDFELYRTLNFRT